MLFFKSVLIGLAISIPLGPLGLLCIKKTLDQGMWVGLSVGLGIAVADMVAAILVNMGLQQLFHWLSLYQMYFQIITGALCLYLGFLDVVSKSVLTSDAIPLENWSHRWFFQSFFLTLTNPWIFFVFPSFLAAFQIYATSVLSISFMGFGVFVGSMVWWFFLTQLTHTSRKFFSQKILKKIQKASGYFLIFVGLGLLVFAFCHNE